MFPPLRTVPLGIAAGVWVSSAVYASPVGPVYTPPSSSCVASPPSLVTHHRWTLNAACDSEEHEGDGRTTPTSRVEKTIDGEVAAGVEYYRNLDLVMAQAGADGQYLFVAIKMLGLHVVGDDGTLESEGLSSQYETLASVGADGGSRYWLAFAQRTPPGTSGDAGAVGGNGDEGGGIDDGVPRNGRLAGTEGLFTRLMPNDPSVVEFAIDYRALGVTQEEVQGVIDRSSGSFDVRAIDGPPDPDAFLWHAHPANETIAAHGAAAGDLTKSEFGTQRRIPETIGLLLGASGLGLAWAVRRRRGQ